ncbi:MAG: penicillin-binding protein 2 [bacterium]|nr:penicillin-binding protein 2 [bacterium]
MWRLWFIFCSICLVYLGIIIRLFSWQVVNGSSLRLQANLQHRANFLVPSERGSIVDRAGNPLVINQPAFLVYGKPEEIENRSEFAKKAAPFLSLDASLIEEQLSLPDRLWVPLVHKLEKTRVEELKALALPGIGFESEPKRYYAEASIAAHLLGFVGSDQNGVDTGYFGIEGYYDRELRGKDGRIEIEQDASGAPILFGSAERIEPENGRTLGLWVDRSIQFFVERRLFEGIESYGAKEGSVVVMDPATGGILAMASYPSYNPNTFSVFDKELYRNPVVAATYEPGSTFKALVMAAALNKQSVRTTTTIEESGPVSIGNYSIRTWNDEYGGRLTMGQVLERSSNVGMVYVGRALGKENLLSSIRDFGFGQVTGIDLEDEASPVLRPDSEWGEIDLATATFGQGIAVTPLQMVRAVGALANRGWLMKPMVVREIVENNGKKILLKSKRLKQVVSEKTAKLITEMLVSAVDNGEAKWAKPKGYRIAGKTGTAQIPVLGHYDDKKTIASFVGYAPADDPKFVMLVTLREPTSSPWGSETAAPLFFHIASDIFLYYGILPD